MSSQAIYELASPLIASTSFNYVGWDENANGSCVNDSEEQTKATPL